MVSENFKRLFHAALKPACIRLGCCREDTATASERAARQNSWLWRLSLSYLRPARRQGAILGFGGPPHDKLFANRNGSLRQEAGTGEELLEAWIRSQGPAIISNVPCPTADSLFEKFAEATHEHFEATDNLSMLTGQHESFAEAQKIVDEKRSKSHAARRALEQHWKKHGCRGASKTGHEGYTADYKIPI